MNAELSHQTSPTAWSCLPTALANAIRVPVDDFIARCLHDGSEIIDPELPKPECYRGFHVQECIDVALSYGHECVQISRYPMMQGRHGEPISCKFEGWTADQRFAAHLADTYGVLGGLTLDGKDHAVTWRDGKIFDCRNGTTYSLARFNPLLYIRIGPKGQTLLLHKVERVGERFNALFNEIVTYLSNC